MALNEKQKDRLRKLRQLLLLMRQNIDSVYGAGTCARNWLGVLGEAGDVTETIKLLEKLFRGNIVIDEDEKLTQLNEIPQKTEINDDKNESHYSQGLLELKKEVSILKQQMKEVCDEQKRIQTVLDSKLKDEKKQKDTSKQLEEVKTSNESAIKENKKEQTENRKDEDQKLKVRLTDASSKQMKNLVERYNLLYEKGRTFRTDFTLTLLDEEVNLRENNSAKSEQEKMNRPATLQKADGNPNYYGEPINGDETKLFVIPVKSIAINSESLWTNAYAYFFKIQNRELIQPKDGISPYVLLQPAIVEKSNNNEYQLLLPGSLELK